MSASLDRARAMFSGKKVLIFGLGLLGGGVGDARFFVSIGAKVTVTDLKTDQQLSTSIASLSGLPITFHLGTHLEEDVRETDFILRNPSVPVDQPLLLLARSMQKPILMRSSLFARLSQIPVIGITGTRGKTTTTTMIYNLLTRLTDKHIFLAGNISGMSDLELLPKIVDEPNSLAVMELSSWQLQGFKEESLSPHIAVITNLYPDHLNRYSSLESYYEDKHEIITHQSNNDWAILNNHQPEFHTWAKTAAGQILWFDEQKLPELLSLKIPGQHNRANAAAALSVAKVLNLDENQAIQILNEFSGVNFRLQTIATKNGIQFINDTTATTPTAAEAALKSMPHPPIIILGGASKNLPLDSLIQNANQLAKSIVLLTGEGTKLITPHLKPELIAGEADSMDSAVKLAYSKAKSGDIILLSPGFASFGLFVNEFDRGDQFNQCVQNLN